eukprot:6185112-Pleurochrysis_carterae.AAC.1
MCGCLLQVSSSPPRMCTSTISSSRGDLTTQQRPHLLRPQTATRRSRPVCYRLASCRIANCRTVGQQLVLVAYGSTPQHGTSCP